MRAVGIQKGPGDIYDLLVSPNQHKPGLLCHHCYLYRFQILFRRVLHKSIGSAYREIDEQAHRTAQEMYNNYQHQVQETAAKYSQGLISEGEVTQAFADMATQTHQTLNGIVQEALPYFQKYMETHPQFELSEVGKAMDYLVPVSYTHLVTFNLTSPKDTLTYIITIKNNGNLKAKIDGLAESPDYLNDIAFP